jgi:hypothetical protein
MVVAAVGAVAARPDRTPLNGFASRAYPPNLVPSKNTRVPQKMPQKMSAAWGRRRSIATATLIGGEEWRLRLVCHVGRVKLEKSLSSKIHGPTPLTS